MGMTGTYIAVDDKLLHQIMDGERTITDINTSQYHALDIDKAWHAIHYLLCAEVFDGQPPAGYVVPIRIDNQIDCECGIEAFCITAPQVKEAAAYLSSLSDDTIEEWFDFKAMQEEGIYPLWRDDNEKEFYEYVCLYLSKLRKYFKQRAEKENAVIFYIM